MRVGIIGLGLIGGSLARDLAAAGWDVRGTDRDAATERQARESGVISGPVAPDANDLVILAVPVRSAPGWLHHLAPELGPDTVITDVGSTKRSVVEAAEAAGLGRRFVGSHPVAGHQTSGWAASRTGLFRGATVWITPTPESEPGAVARVESLWRAVGGEPRQMAEDEHDRLLARASHLPQVVATALGVALGRAAVGPDDLGPGGRDTTRLAGSDPEVWADILTDNGDEVAPALAAFIDELLRFRRALEGMDDATLRSLLAAGRSWARGEAERTIPY